MFNVKDGLRIGAVQVINAAGNILTNAASSDKLSSARTVTVTGDVSGILTTDFSSNATLTLLLPNLTTAGTFGNSSYIPRFSLDATGRITAITTVPVDALTLNGNNSSFFTNATNISSGTISDARLPTSLSGKTFTGSINLSDFDITNVNLLSFNDPGPEQGLRWNGGNLWKIYESPDDLVTNSGGNLQFVQNTTRRMTLMTNGALMVANGLVWTSMNDGAASGLDADLLDGQHGAFYQNATNITSGTLSMAILPAVNLTVGDFGSNKTVSHFTVNDKGLITNAANVAISLSAVANVTTAADTFIYATGSDIFATTSLTPFARTLLGNSNASTMQTTLGLVPGTDIVGYNALLASYAAHNWVAGTQVPTLTAANTVTLATVGNSVGNLLDRNAGDSLYVSLTAPQTVGGSKTFSNTLTAANVVTGGNVFVSGNTYIGGLATSAGAMLKPSGTTILARLGDDSADANISAASGVFSGKIAVGLTSVKTPAAVFFTGGNGDGTLNEANSVMIRSRNADGNSPAMVFSVSNVAGGGSNQGQGFIQFGYWGGAYTNPLRIQPKGGQVALGPVQGTLGDWSSTTVDRFCVKAPNGIFTGFVPDSIGGRVIFGPDGATTNAFNQLAWIGGVWDQTNWYNGQGLVFATLGSPFDNSGSTGTERLRIQGTGHIRQADGFLYRLGGDTAAYPAFKRNGTNFSVRKADDSGDAGLLAGDGTFSGNVVVNGNLLISGSTVTVNSTTLNVADTIITVGANNVGSIPYLGLKAERGGTDAYLLWDEANVRWGAFTSSVDPPTSPITALFAASQFISDISTGSAPFVVNSTTMVANLNADLLDGQHGSFYQNASNLNSGTISSARMPAFTGDASSPIGSTVLTLASVNSNIGSFGNATYIPVLTVNDKGLVTAISNIAITPAWLSITGTPTTLAGYGITDAQPVNNLLTSYGSQNWSSGVQVPTLTASNTVTLRTVGSSSGNLLDKAAGDILYLGINATAANAVNAVIAANAVYATDAGHATNADNAILAANATLAANAVHATNADNATNATTAANAILLNGQPDSFYLNASNLGAGTLSTARLPAFSGDASSPAGSSTLTLATVNSNVGTFGNAINVPIVTVNGKGLVTAASSVPIVTGSGVMQANAGVISASYTISNSGVTVSNTTAFFGLTSPAATSPAGRWRIQAGSGGNINIVRNTAVAGDFSTSSTDFYIDTTGQTNISGNVAVTGTATFSGASTFSAPATFSNTITFSGIQTNTSGRILIDAASTIDRFIQTNSSGSTRWIMYTATGTETGSNAGSDFSLRAYNDAGTLLGSALNITRSSRVVNFPVAPTFSDGSGTRVNLGLGTAAVQNIGTSGANVPLLNGGNTWSALQTHTLTSGGVVTFPLMSQNANSTNGSGTGLYLDPTGNGLSSRGASIYATTNGGNQITLHFATSNAAAPVDVLTLGPTGTPTVADAAGWRTALALGTAATQNIGTSGATVPLLNAGNTWSTLQTFTGLTSANGDITAYRTGGTTGVIFLNQAQNRYLYYDGSIYHLNGANLELNGGTAWHSANDGSGSGLDADLLDGMNSSVVVAGSTIVARDASGYIYGQYLNQGSTNNENPTISQIMVTNGSDNFLRKAQIQHLINSMSPSAAQIVANSTTGTPRMDLLWAALNFNTLTDAATITPDFSLSINFALSIAGNRTMAAPINMKSGQCGMIYIAQAGGPFTMSFNSTWKFQNLTAPSLTARASALDCLVYMVINTSYVVAALIKGTS